LLRRNRRSNRTEPPELPPEPPVAVEPEPVVRAILVGPAGETQNRLFELLSAQQEIEIFALCERADEAMATLFNLPARRRTAVLLDAKLPGTHDAGWLIRRLRERHPVLRLFAYCEEPDDDAMESVALAGVDEVLVVVGEDADRETLDAFERQFDLRPGAPTERVPVVEEEAPAEPVVDEPPAEPVVVDDVVDSVEVEEPIAEQAPPVTTAAASTEIVPSPEGPHVPQKRGRHHRRSASKAQSDPADESAVLRNLERELASVRVPALETRRLDRRTTHTADESPPADAKREDATD